MAARHIFIGACVVGSALIAGAGFGVTYAQDVPSAADFQPRQVASPSPSFAPVMLTDRPDYQKDIADLTASYRGQLTEYRDLEREFVVAKEQYKQLNTLAALENGIQATKKVMLARQLVIETYLRLLRVQLLDAEGIEVQIKEAAITQIGAQLTDLGVHKQEIEAIDDRTDIVQVVDHFSKIGPATEQTSYYALSLLTVAKLQVVVDRGRALKDEVAIAVESSENPATKDQRQRAIRETTRTLDEAQAKLSTLKEQIATNRESSSRSSFTQLGRDLSPAYASASQALSYLEEVLNTYVLGS